MLPKVAAVILNWNGYQDTIDLLESLKVTTYEPLLIVVIDNASTNESVACIEQWLNNAKMSCACIPWASSASMPDNSVRHAKEAIGKHCLFIKSNVNLGFCAGNNLGMKLGVELGAEYLLVLNNDTLVAPDFLQPMVDVAERDENVGLVGGIITYYEEPDTIWWAGGAFDRFLNNTRLLDRQPLGALRQFAAYETEWVSGCMMMIPTRIHTRFGGFVEEYFIWSEEWDYSLQVSRAGYKLMVAPQTRICHKVGHSLGVMKPLNYYYGVRNGLLFQHKYLPDYLWYPYLIYYLLNRAVRYTQLTLQGRGDLARAGVSAVFDFLTGVTGKWRNQPT